MLSWANSTDYEITCELGRAGWPACCARIPSMDRIIRAHKCHGLFMARYQFYVNH
jgi:hypothetical protein